MPDARPSRWAFVWPAIAVVPVIVALVFGQGLFTPQARRTGDVVRPPTAAPKASSRGYPLARGRWHLALDASFSGDRPGPEWSTSRFGDGRIAAGFNFNDLQCYDPRLARVADGKLTLALVRRRELCDGKRQPYSSGILTTTGRWSFRYGLLEARVWVPSRGGRIVDWPAVWAAGSAELDVLEGGARPCWYYHRISITRGGCLKHVHLTGGWHIVAADWEPHHITWYYDHRQVARVGTHIASGPMSVVLDLAISSYNRQPHVIPAKFKIDWVRVWQPIRRSSAARAPAS
jgi:beta-glucanase (GH16 family)